MDAIGSKLALQTLDILHEAYGAFRNPRIIDAPGTGLAVNGAATALNAIWCDVLIRRALRR